MAGKADAVLVLTFFIGAIVFGVVHDAPVQLGWGLMAVVFIASIFSHIGTVAFIWIVSLAGAWFAPEPLKPYSAAMASVTFFMLIIKGVYKLIKGRRERERVVYVPIIRRVPAERSTSSVEVSTPKPPSEYGVRSEVVTHERPITTSVTATTAVESIQQPKVVEVRRELRIEDLLSTSLGGLVGGYASSGEVFQAVINEVIAPKGFSGTWSCIKLGCGGWGCAYKCVEGRRVVVFKVPRGLEDIIERSEVPTVSEDLLRKVGTVANVIKELNHPNILKLIAYSSRAPILVYEFADYGSIQWQLSMGWRPSLKDVLLVAIQVGDALRYIHSRGLVHGDIKAGNVFITEGIAKVGDFSSIVKLLSQTSAHSRFSATPGWRAPEQVYSDLRRRAIERGLENRIDVYQLGNLILYLLTRETVDGEDAVNDAIVKEAINKVPNNDLRNLLRTMLKLDPEDRPSADEVVRELIKIYEQVA